MSWLRTLPWAPGEFLQSPFKTEEDSRNSWGILERNAVVPRALLGLLQGEVGNPLVLAAATLLTVVTDGLEGLLPTRGHSCVPGLPLRLRPDTLKMLD